MQKTYKLAKKTDHAVIPFGPFFTLEKAQAYQADMEKGGLPVLVVNMAQGIDWHMRPNNRKGWMRTAH